MKKTLASLTLASLVCASGVWAQVGEDTPDYDERVAKVLRELDVDYTIDSDGDFKVIEDMGGGRTQLAFVRSFTSEYRHLEVREIWSVGYESDTDSIPGDIANLLLDDTFDKKLGAWAKMNNMAVYVVKISANADAETVRSGLTLAMEAADEMEEKLSGDTDAF